MRQRRLKHVLAAAALLPCTTTGAWIPPAAAQRHCQTTNIHAYLDDDGSAPGVNGKRQAQQQESAATTTNDYTGAGTLGDIMSRETATSGLVTTDGGLLYKKFGITSPLDRMALTANGNLQRLFSSYYDAPVHVVVDSCIQVSPKCWNRVVHLTVHETMFCTATSQITVNDEKCRTLVESGNVGLGQLFRHLDKLPSFSLLDAGYCPDRGGMWRVYELECEELTCHIEERFLPRMWNIEAPPPQEDVDNNEEDR